MHNRHRILISVMMFIAVAFFYINAPANMSITNNEIGRMMEHVDQWLSASYLRSV